MTLHTSIFSNNILHLHSIDVHSILKQRAMKTFHGLKGESSFANYWSVSSTFASYKIFICALLSMWNRLVKNLSWVRYIASVRCWILLLARTALTLLWMLLNGFTLSYSLTDGKLFFLFADNYQDVRPWWLPLLQRKQTQAYVSSKESNQWVHFMYCMKTNFSALADSCLTIWNTIIPLQPIIYPVFARQLTARKDFSSMFS